MSSRPLASMSSAARMCANPKRGPPGMTTKGAPSPIRTYVSSVPATGTVPVRVATSAIAWRITSHPRTSVRELRHLYAERGSPKFAPAARRWLVRYLIEGTPGLDDVAKVGGREYREAG